MFAANLLGIRYRVEEWQVMARMNTSMVREALDFGFSHNIVLDVIRKQLVSYGKSEEIETFNLSLTLQKFYSPQTKFGAR